MFHVIGAYFHRHGIVRHQLETYDNFMTRTLPHIVAEATPYVHTDGELVHAVSICNVSVQRPVNQECDGYDCPILPHMARMRSVTYAACILVDIVHDTLKGGQIINRRVFREVLLGKLPVMVGSMYCHTHKTERVGECRLDQGGYFIINGIEKALLAQAGARRAFVW